MKKENLKTVAMIPARYAATRFPGKLMQKLEGKTVIRRTYEATVSAGLFDDVWVVTDSDGIYDEITGHGGHAMMSKKEHGCGSDRIAEAAGDMDVDIVVNVQGDEPFTKKEDLKKLLEVFYGGDAQRTDLASVMTPIRSEAEHDNPNTVKVVVDRDNFAIYFSRAPIPYFRVRQTAPAYYKHRGIYAFRKQALMDFYSWPAGKLEKAEKIECLRYIEYGRRIKMVESDLESVGIDSPEDLVCAKKLLQRI